MAAAFKNPRKYERGERRIRRYSSIDHRFHRWIEGTREKGEGEGTGGESKSFARKDKGFYSRSGTVDYFLYLRYHRTRLTLWVASGVGRGIDGLFRETGCHIHVLTLSWLTNGLLLSQARVTARARPLQLVFPANRPKRVHGLYQDDDVDVDGSPLLPTKPTYQKKRKRKNKISARSSEWTIDAGENVHTASPSLPLTLSLSLFLPTERHFFWYGAQYSDRARVRPEARGYSCRSSPLLHIYRVSHCARVSRDADIFCHENPRY